MWTIPGLRFENKNEGVVKQQPFHPQLKSGHHQMPKMENKGSAVMHADIIDSDKSLLAEFRGCKSVRQMWEQSLVPTDSPWHSKNLLLLMRQGRVGRPSKGRADVHQIEIRE